MLKTNSSIQCSDEIKEKIREDLTSLLREIEQSGCKENFQIGIEARYVLSYNLWLCMCTYYLGLAGNTKSYRRILRMNNRVVWPNLNQIYRPTREFQSSSIQGKLMALSSKSIIRLLYYSKS